MKAIAAYSIAIISTLGSSSSQAVGAVPAANILSLPGQAFSAQAPPPSEWGFANYGQWVVAGSGNKGYTRIRANSTNGVSIIMQVYYKDVNGNDRIEASGGLASSVDYSFRAKPGTTISARFKVGTLDNDRKSGAFVTGASS